MPTIQEDEVAEVAGEDNDDNDPEEADHEPDQDDSDFEEPPAEYAPTAQEQKDLQIAHANAGHPTAKDFARMLRRGNARPEIAHWVSKHF